MVSLVLRGSPKDVGLQEPAVNKDNLFGRDGDESKPHSLTDLLRPYLTSLPFWLVCGLSFGMTLIRETLNIWVPVYLVDAHHVAPGAAAQYSALFPLVGGISSLAVGVTSDRLGGDNRVALMVPAMIVCAIALAALSFGTVRGDLPLSLLAISLTALSLLGPYTLLAGAIAMDMGGRKGSATAAGFIDTAGYAGGALSGFAVARLAEMAGWAAVFNALATLAAAVSAVAALYCIDHRRRSVLRAQPQGS